MLYQQPMMKLKIPLLMFDDNIALTEFNTQQREILGWRLGEDAWIGVGMPWIIGVGVG
jgi:hypothetical protein